MFLFVGLGNPGKEYSLTRHNVGFMAVDYLSNRHNFSWLSKAKFQAELAAGSFAENKLFLAKPQTFMNLSGRSIVAIKNYYHIILENIFVIHDDIDLEVGKIKIKQGGGNAGHNGLKSLDQNIGSNYYRIRIGVGRPKTREEVANYVLSNFTSEEFSLVEQSIKVINENMDLLLAKKIEEFKKKIG